MVAFIFWFIHKKEHLRYQRMFELELIEQKIHEQDQLEQLKLRLLSEEAIKKEPTCEISPQQKLSIVIVI